MVLVAPEDRYPQWSDNENNFDPRVDKLIDDILSDQLVRGCWAATKQVSKKRGRQYKEEKGKKQKKQKKQNLELEKSSNVQDKDDVNLQLVKLVGTLIEKVEDMQKKYADYDGFAAMVKAKLEVLEHRSERRRGHAKNGDESVSSASKKIEEKEDDGASTKTPANVNTPEVGTNKTPSTGSGKTPSRGSGKTPSTGSGKTPERIPFKIPELDDCSETPSWLVEQVEAGSDGLPSTKVVKIAKTVARSGKAQHEDQLSDDVVDVTEQQQEENMKMASPCGDFAMLQDKRIPMLADTQKSPYLPNSTVKRIIPGVMTSGNDYDPMLPVAEEKWKRFEEWMKQYE